MAGLLRAGLRRSRHFLGPLASQLTPPHLGLLPAASRQLHGASAAWQSKEELSSGKAASSTPPDNPQDFTRYADLYLGDIWNKLEKGLREVEGESFEYDVEMQGGKMVLTLPDSAQIVIRKDHDHSALVVHSNLHDFIGSYDSGNEVSFKLSEGRFETDGEPLHTYIEDGLAKHLKIQVDLEPELDHLYGPDPT